MTPAAALPIADLAGTAVFAIEGANAAIAGVISHKNVAIQPFDPVHGPAAPDHVRVRNLR
jgi:hypothetical protein